MEANEELPSPDSLGSSFDNSIKKGVSFANNHVMLEGEDGAEKKGWKWRRKQRKAVRKRRQVRKRTKKDEPFFLDEYSDDNSEASIDSFEAKAMAENRDEQNLDGDLWEESDSREQEGDVKESQGLWTFFAFGNNEKDSDDGLTEGGWTEGDSTFHTETSKSSYNSHEVLRNNSDVSSLDSDSEVEEIEVEIKSIRSLKTEEATNDTLMIKPVEERRDETPASSNYSLLPTGRIEWDQRGSVYPSSRPTTPATVPTADTSAASEPGDRQAGVMANRSQMSGETSTKSERLSEQKVAVNSRKKKKTRWKVGRGKAGSNKSSRNDVDKPSSTPQVLKPPVSDEQRDTATSHCKTEVSVDDGERGIAHKSCMPVLFHERQHRSREAIGKLLCHSQRVPYHTIHGGASSVRSDLTSQATSRASTPAPQVRIVSDNQGNQGPTVVGDGTGEKQSDIRQQMELQESDFASSQGPQSIYIYEYDSGTPMDVRYKQFGNDPEELLLASEYVMPMRATPGSNDVVIMVEVRDISFVNALSLFVFPTHCSLFRICSTGVYHFVE